MRSLLLALALALAAACATSGAPRLLAGGGVQRGAGFSTELPPGWMRAHGGDAGEALAATRDGFPLQWLQVECWKPPAPGLLPEEVAELTASLLGWRANATLTASRPATLAGRAGYRVELTYREGGLDFRYVAVGAELGERRCRVSYAAPARHYFERDLPAFERAVETFAFAPAP
jgi:hypothetical protein